MLRRCMGIIIVPHESVKFMMSSPTSHGRNRPDARLRRHGVLAAAGGALSMVVAEKHTKVAQQSSKRYAASSCRRSWEGRDRICAAFAETTK